MAYQEFEDLEVWQLARRLSGDIYRALDSCRDYHFRNQITDASNSISSNIAEGSERLHRAEYIQFLGYAKGSAGEVRSQLYLAEDLGYMTKETATNLRRDVRLIGGKLYALIKRLGGDT